MSSTPTSPHSTAPPGATSSSLPTLVLTNQELALEALVQSPRRLGRLHHDGALGQRLFAGGQGRHDLAGAASTCGRAPRVATPTTGRRRRVVRASGTRGRGLGDQRGRSKDPQRLPPMHRAPGTSAASSRSAGPTSTSGATTRSGTRRAVGSLLAATSSASRTITSTATPTGSSFRLSTRPSTTTPIAFAARASLVR